MGKAACRLLQRIHQVAQHAIVDGDLFGIAPASYEARPFIEGGVDDMRHIPEDAEYFGTRLRIGEVRRDKPSAKSLVGTPAGNGDHLAGGIARKMFHGGVANEA